MCYIFDSTFSLNTHVLKVLSFLKGMRLKTSCWWWIMESRSMVKRTHNLNLYLHLKLVMVSPSGCQYVFESWSFVSFGWEI